MTDEPTDENGPNAPAAPKLATKKRPRVATRQQKREREQSSIQFPYMDLEAAISVARAILSGGGVALSRDQLAGVMNLASGSGNFVQKVATSRIFGLVTFAGGKYELSNLGFSILDSDERKQKVARAESFLTVPLYKRTYEEFRGKQLPPRPHGLEQAFVKFGVSIKQKTNARLAFDKSATQAGFFLNGPDRLIQPIIGVSASSERGRPTADDNGNLPDEIAPPERTLPVVSGLHPFIEGLLDTLPEPHTNWTIEGRAKWLQAAAHIFDLIYNGSGEIDIKAKPDPNSTE